MNKNLHNIDEFFKAEIEGLEDEPSSNVWESIDKDLDKRNVVSISKKYHKLKLVASFLLIFSLGMAMYVLHLNKKNKVDLKKDYPIALKDEKELMKNETEQSKDIADNKSFNQKEKPALRTFPFQDRSGQNADSQRPNVENGIKQLPGTISKTEGGKEIAISGSKLKSANSNFEEKNLNKVGIIKDNLKDENFKSGEINKTNRTISKIDEQKSNINAVSESIQILNKQVLAIHLSNDGIVMSKNNLLKSLNITNSASIKYTGVKITILKPIHESQFYATVFFSPDIVSYNLKSDQPQFEEDTKSEIKKNEKPQSANSFGVLVGYRINGNWIIQSGAMISNRITSINSKTIYARPDRNGNINYRLSCFTGPSYIPLKSGVHPALGDSTDISAKNTLQYVSIPIVLQYRITKGRLSVNPGIGIATNFLLINKIESVMNTSNGYQNSTTSASGLRSSYFNGLIDLNAAYKINNRIAFSVTPVARLGLSSISKDAPVKTTLNSFGFGAGLNIEL